MSKKPAPRPSKIEGPRIDLVRALTEAEIPVVGHLGLTPQSVHRMGGYRVQARTAETVLQLKADAHALADAGAGASCLKAFPAKSPPPSPPSSPFQRSASAQAPIATARSSSSTTCVNLTFAPAAKFVRRYGDAAALIRSAIEHYREDVEHRAFPSDKESYHLPETAQRALESREAANRKLGTLRKA